MLPDLRFTLRQLGKSPGFTITAVLALALGIAASTAIFAFLDAALLAPLPYRNPSRLVVAFETTAHCRECEISYPDFQDWKAANSVFSAFEVWKATVVVWRSSAGAQAVRSARVSGGFFQTLGVAAMMGRVFLQADDQPAAPRAVVLTYDAWQSRFDGRPGIIGQSLDFDGVPYAVIGVLPREFHFAMRAAEFFTTVHDLTDCDRSRDCYGFEGLARLRDGVPFQAAAAESKQIARRLETEFPESHRGRSVGLTPIRDEVVGDIRPTLVVLGGAAGLLLLIAGVNVAGLILVRAESRRKEIALRGALGASAGRLLRQFAVEAVALVSLALLVALPLAAAAIPRMFQLIPERRLRGLPYFRYAGINPRTLLFTAAVAVLAAALFTAIPAMRLSLRNLRQRLEEGGRGAASSMWGRFGANLVAAELSIAMVLLVSAGLLGKSLFRMLHVDLNFNPSNLATLEVDVHDAGYAAGSPRLALSRRLREQLAAVPGVLSVAHTTSLPVTCNCDSAELRILGHAWNGERETVLERQTSAEYFKLLQARLLRGRFYTEADDASKPRVAVINRALAQRYFPGEDPLGRTIGDRDLSPRSLAQIIGVVDDIREGDLVEPLTPAVYYPFNQSTSLELFVVVRTGPDAASMMPALQAAIHRVDPNLGVRNEFVMEDRIFDSPAAFLNRSSASLVSAFAALALLLGAIGLYGVVAYSVSRRTREIGVRIALGAERGAVYRLILGQAARLAAIGITIGLVCSIATAALLRGLLFGVESWDAPTLVFVALLLALCVLAASYLPAKRAASLNPVEALRAD